MKTNRYKLVFSIIAVLLIIGCGGGSKIDKTAALENAKRFFAVLPDKMPGSENDTPELIALGEKMYFDVRLSDTNEMSCNTCHLLDGKHAGVDNLPTSPGTNGEFGTRNSPTVLNAGFHFVQFWDGRAADLKEQAKGPILNPVEMSMPNEAEVVAKLSADTELIGTFNNVFPNTGLTYDNIAEAIAAFERTLITHDRFDDFLNGDLNALSDEEVEGLNTFVSTGCITCHIGPLLGGNMYQKMGLVVPYKDIEDTGRHMVTNMESDKFMFKVPSMRNVALTAPYFHDGGVEELDEAVIEMAKLELGKELTNAEVKSIVVFLKSLTDKELAAAN